MLRHLQWSASKEKLVCKLRVLFMKIKNISLAKMTSIFAIAFLVCAHAHALTISGTLTSGGKPLRGIIILGSGGISDASTDKLGKYSLIVPILLLPILGVGIIPSRLFRKMSRFQLRM